MVIFPIELHDIFLNQTSSNCCGSASDVESTATMTLQYYYKPLVLYLHTEVLLLVDLYWSYSRSNELSMFQFQS